MTVPLEEATANYVPAAAVIRRWRALSGIIGRKGSAGGKDWSIGEEIGIPGVAVECVDIWKNTESEGRSLDDN